MEISTLTALITAGSAVIGGLIAATASLLSNKRKIQEMKLDASQRLRENYLSNARAYANGIYVPLALAVSRLYDAYYIFKNTNPSSDSRRAFINAIDSFLSEYRRLRNSGAEAFLTNELEDRLRIFSEFLNDSMISTQIKRRAVIFYHIGFGSFKFSETNELTLEGKKATWFRSPKLKLSFFGMGATYEAEILLSAPLESIEFNERFISDSSEIRILIKEVTLGGGSK